MCADAAGLGDGFPPRMKKRGAEPSLPTAPRPRGTSNSTRPTPLLRGTRRALPTCQEPGGSGWPFAVGQHQRLRVVQVVILVDAPTRWGLLVEFLLNERGRGGRRSGPGHASGHLPTVPKNITAGRTVRSFGQSLKITRNLDPKLFCGSRRENSACARAAKLAVVLRQK